MAPEEQDAPEDKGDEGWLDVGDGAPPPPKDDEAAASTSEAEEDEIKAYGGKKPTPPWKVSLYTGIVGLLLMAVIFVLPELRRIATPWDPSYPTAYILLVFPVLALVWAAIGLLGAQFRDERSLAWRGLFLALLTLALGYAVIATDPARDAQESLVDTDERLEMTDEELREWRIEKLNR